MTTSTAPAPAPALDQSRATYGVADIAHLAGCSTRHVHRLNDLGRIPGRIPGLGRMVRFSKAAVDAWLAGDRKGA